MEQSSNPSSLSVEDKDPLFRIKYMGYCLGNIPKDTENVPIQDFVRIAKFNLATKYGYLMEDPVWDRYTDEQILVEYFAMVYSIDKDSKAEFEGILKGATQDDYDWFEEQIRKNKVELEEQKRKADEELKAAGIEAIGDDSEGSDEDEFEFTPETGEDY